MNKKRRKTTIVISAVVAVVLVCALLVRGFAFSAANPLARATVHCEYNGTVTEERLSAKDWWTIATMFNGKPQKPDMSRCPKSESLSIKAGRQTYYIGRDDCGLIYSVNREKVFFLEGAELQAMRAILSKYIPEKGLRY